MRRDVAKTTTGPVVVFLLKDGILAKFLQGFRCYEFESRDKFAVDAWMADG